MIMKKTEKKKTCAMKQKLILNDYKYCLEKTQYEYKLNQLEKTKLMWIVLKKIMKNS